MFQIMYEHQGDWQEENPLQLQDVSGATILGEVPVSPVEARRTANTIYRALRLYGDYE
ncbi:MAG: hypothetical protein AAF639_28375 [Chloroflexota bacterium]